MSFPCEIAPQSSRVMMAGLLVGHLLLGLAFLFSSLPIGLVGLAWIVLAMSGVAAYRRWRQMARWRFVLGQEGTLHVIPPIGPAFEAKAGRHCRDLGWGVWLAWQGMAEGGGGQEGILMLTRDALTRDAWRALRIWLKFRSGLASPD
jgi:hypothetical protein